MPRNKIIIAIYVDDLLITGSNLSIINNIKQFLDDKFSIKDLGLLHYFLGFHLKLHYRFDP